MTLKVVALVKQVPDLEALVRVQAPDRLEIEERYACSFYDEIAIEAALELRKLHPESELLALSAGGKHAQDALRRAMAMGFDQVEQLADDRLAQADSLGVALVLAARLATLRPDLVLCGKQALDDDQAAVGPMLAELLDIPHVSAAVSLQLDVPAGTAEVGRKLEGEVWTLRLPLPLLVSVEKGLAKPHLPVVTRVMKAMKAKIPNLTLDALLPDAAALGGRIRPLAFRPPPSRPAVTMMSKPFPENVAELLATLHQTGVL